MIALFLNHDKSGNARNIWTFYWCQKSLSLIIKLAMKCWSTL